MKASHTQYSHGSQQATASSGAVAYHPPSSQHGLNEVALTVYDPCLPSDSSLSSSDVRLDTAASGSVPIATGGGLTEPFLPRDSEPLPQS